MPSHREWRSHRYRQDEKFHLPWVGDYPTLAQRRAYMKSFFNWMVYDPSEGDTFQALWRSSESRAATQLVDAGWKTVPVTHFEFTVDRVAWGFFFHFAEKGGPGPDWPWPNRPPADPSEPKSEKFAQLRVKVVADKAKESQTAKPPPTKKQAATPKPGNAIKSSQAKPQQLLPAKEQARPGMEAKADRGGSASGNKGKAAASPANKGQMPPGLSRSPSSREHHDSDRGNRGSRTHHCTEHPLTMVHSMTLEGTVGADREIRDLHVYNSSPRSGLHTNIMAPEPQIPGVFLFRTNSESGVMHAFNQVQANYPDQKIMIERFPIRMPGGDDGRERSSREGDRAMTPADLVNRALLRARWY
ncbi:hypothetical protein BGZ63DRAFT_42034 [Mariannaea sp. PMI_226]|nr:hypothetical protein BGZ63DRAFT_42034 [Mariannaea sp. PMI_226]